MNEADTRPMKVSEKSLELNIGAELLGVIRNGWGMSKAYLRGLTQREESQEGVDFFVQLDPATRLFAFQFKAPQGAMDVDPYRYRLVRDQHDLLYSLAQLAGNSVFYVFPYYVTTNKLQEDVPTLMQDTWLLGVDTMPTPQVFATARSKVVRCQGGQANINPEYQLSRLQDLSHSTAFTTAGVPAEKFKSWYSQYLGAPPTVNALTPVRRTRNPWRVRGLRVAIVVP